MAPASHPCPTLLVSSVTGKGQFLSRGHCEFLCTGGSKEEMLEESGERGGAIALWNIIAVVCISLGLCVIRESESSHIALSTETTSWLEGWWVTHSR